MMQLGFALHAHCDAIVEGEHTSGSLSAQRGVLIGSIFGETVRWQAELTCAKPPIPAVVRCPNISRMFSVDHCQPRDNEFPNTFAVTWACALSRTARLNCPQAENVAKLCSLQL